MINKIFSIFVFSISIGILFGIYLHKQKYPLISVILPVYNRADFLPRAIESILNQTYQKWELLILDDGSTDNSLAIAKRYAVRDERIKVFSLPHNGVISARNKGFDVARGKYIALLDSDDASTPDRLEKQVRYLETHPNITLLGTAVLPFNSNRAYDFFMYNHSFPTKLLNAVFLSGIFPVIQGTCMIRRDFMEKHHIRYDYKYNSLEDYSLYEQIFDNGGQFATLPVPLYLYRLHRTHSKDFYEKVQKIMREAPKNKWNRLFPNIPYGNNFCERMNALIPISKKYSFLSEKDIRDFTSKYCKNNQYIHSVSHYNLKINNQQEIVLVNKTTNRFYSYIMKKSGLLISGLDNIALILWDGDKKPIEYTF